MLPKPSLVLQAMLLPDDFSEQCAEEIKRSYIYLAQPITSELAEGEREDGNIMRLSIRLMKPYWNPQDPAAEELWRESFMPWLTNATRNISTAMHNYNTVLHPLGCHNISYAWADYDFAPHALLRVKVNEDNRITDEAPALCDKARTLLNEGVFGDDVSLIYLPSKASLAAQAEEARKAAEAAQAASANAADEDAAAPGDVNAAEPDAHDASDAPRASIDYSIWGIQRADGTVEEFDSRSSS